MRLIVALLCALSVSLSGFAQHAKSQKSGLYNFPYKGDTWTGEIVGFNGDTREITLQYTDKKGRTETFTGRVKLGVKVNVKDKPDERNPSLNVGDRIIAYYIAPGQKYFILDDAGKKKEVAATENLIFEIELLPPKKDKNKK